METTILTELLKQGPLIALLGLSLYVFYRKDELRRNNDLIEREAMRKKLEEQELKIENYLRTDSLTMQDLIKQSNYVAEKQTLMMNKTNETMICIISEIKDFKKSALYKHHEQNKVNN